MDEARPGAPVVPAARVRVTAEAVRVGPPRAAASAEPQVQVVRDGDLVRAIEVTCPCGACVRIVCEYD
jgi:hypothetical protein